MKEILIVEDNQDIQNQMKWGLSKEYTVLMAADRAEALQLFDRKQPVVVTLDLGLPPDENDSGEGLACLREIMKKSPETKVIIITGNTDRANALAAINAGAYDYYLKPVDMNELKIIIKRAFHLSEIESDNRALHRALNKKMGFAGMIARSRLMESVFETIRQVAATDATVLITGESGTGKELVARAIHDNSSRSQGPFIPINCGAIPENLLESELFGYEKGAFTSAYAQQKGKFEYADGGTLFLDEIGEMSPNLQAKLLRFLQEKKMQRLGGRRDIDIDTRVIAATNVDLNTAMQERTFREDLFFRISVITIAIPPLRDRGDDVMLLAQAFLERYTALFRKKITGFSQAALQEIGNYAWPGNVRELENKLQKAVITASSGMIEPHNLGLENSLAAERGGSGRQDIRYDGITLKEARKRLEIDLITQVVERHKG
ncbi:MAG: PEP-CTERM-box response regulator transcription factor, partial [Nitrospiraceae bacterium]